MKKSIWGNILFYIVIPFLTVYLAFSAVLVQRTYRSSIQKTRQDLLNLGKYYESNLNGFYESAELSVLMSAAEMEMIESGDPGARGIGEDILTSRFHNARVINAWLVFEPNAFDGRDAFHTGDYPGAPSGRYIRSFNRKGNSWEVALDIHEDALDDRDKAYWYIIPRDTGKVFTDLGGYDLLWDYGNNNPVSSIGVVAPVFRDREIIGCVGLDLEMNEKILSEQFFFDAETAIFLPDGRIGYSVHTDNVGKTLEDLGFGDAPKIRKAMEDREPLFLFNEHSGGKSFHYFHPVWIAEKLLYMYTAVPQDYVWENMLPVLRPIGISIAASLVMFLLLLLYLFHGISKPLQKLTWASEAIASGKPDVHIERGHSGDEMGMITKSLSRMAEQFRTSKLLQRQYQDRFDIIMGIHYALFRAESQETAFNAVLAVTAEYFRVFKAFVVFIQEEVPRIAAVYPPLNDEEGGSEFFYHKQVVNLIGNKKHLVMNYGALRSMQLPFADFTAKSMCILPLRVNGLLKGYIIMEGNQSEPFVHDDTTLLFIGDTLAYLLGCRINWPDEKTAETSVSVETVKTVDTVETVKTGEAVKTVNAAENVFVPPPKDAAAFWEKAKTIQGLNVEKGLFFSGGEKDRYAELLRASAKVIGEKIQTLRELCAENIADFGIEVHGMKGALYTIGADLLGDQARQLEFAAKAGNAAYCRESYPEFEEQLGILSQNLAALFSREERNSGTGNTGELKTALEKILEACGVFDNSGALSILNQLNGLAWEDGRIREDLGAIGNDVENFDHEQAGKKIEGLLRYLENVRK